jgi:hypothetical protein
VRQECHINFETEPHQQKFLRAKAINLTEMLSTFLPHHPRSGEEIQRGEMPKSERGQESGFFEAGNSAEKEQGNLGIDGDWWKYQFHS